MKKFNSFLTLNLGHNTEFQTIDISETRIY
jgi:hypothetical protein